MTNLDYVFSVTVRLTACLIRLSRCRRPGHIWSFPVLFNRHPRGPGNDEAVSNVLLRPWSEYHLLMDRSCTCWSVASSLLVRSLAMPLTPKAGLLSLTVEFYRSTPVPYTLEGGDFPYGDTPRGFEYCVEGDSGPWSPMRTHATSEIWVVPAPSSLNFSAATLLAAACCIPAILYLISTWIKILELNWKSRFGTGDLQERIEGTNGATVGGMLRVNAVVRSFLGVLEILLFGAAVVAILVVGEMNFFSEPMMWETEYPQSIGTFAVFGRPTMGFSTVLLRLTDSWSRAMGTARRGSHGGPGLVISPPDRRRRRRGSRRGQITHSDELLLQVCLPRAESTTLQITEYLGSSQQSGQHAQR